MTLNIIVMLMVGAWLPAAPVSSSKPPIVLVKPQEAAARIAACGFKDVRPKFDEALQEDVVEVLDKSSVTPEQMRCAAEVSLDSRYYVVFPTPLYEAYERLFWRMSEMRNIAEGEAWLAERGLLSRLPRYDQKRSNEGAFAHSLELLCGPKATGTLQPIGGRGTFKKGALGTVEKGGLTDGKLDDETITCLLHASTVSGYRIGIIGNEAIQKLP
jgi:hypothetical protein